MIIFGPDPFTVAVDTNIDAYPAGSPNYAYNAGSGANILVVEAVDNVQFANLGAVFVARCINAAVPTTLGNQEARASLRGINGTGLTAPGLGVRYSTGARGYILFLDLSAANEVQIFEDDSGLALLASADRGLSSGVTYASAFRATGGAGSTDLSATIGATAPVTFNDTTAPATGRPAVVGYRSGGVTPGFLDNFLVDNLITAQNISSLLLLGVGN